VCIAVASKINRKMSEVSVMMLAASDSAAAAYGAATSITAQINVLSKLPVQVRASALRQPMVFLCRSRLIFGQHGICVGK
jgi:hypothetical protein